MAKSRDEIRTECAGAVRGPGKFEGAAIYAPYFYEAMLNGEGEPLEQEDGNEQDTMAFPVMPEDVSIFPELAGVDEVRCYEDNNGFFYVWAVR